jgi:AraC-like DNA-binding protein
MKSYIHIQPGLLVIYGSVLNNDWHQHNALQIIWPESDCEIELDGYKSHQAIVIKSELKHRIKMAQGWIILIEPQSRLGESLQAQLQKKDYQEISNLSHFRPHEKPLEITELLPLFQALKLGKIEDNQIPSDLDPRLQVLQQTLNECLEGDCIKPDHWKAALVAQQMGLSESRFLHLFKQQMHIAWRPYLLWRRLLCAVNAIQKGRSATEAAYIAGFSDSAHLSRTFRNNFGMTIRQAGQALLKAQ